MLKFLTPSNYKDLEEKKEMPRMAQTEFLGLLF